MLESHKAESFYEKQKGNIEQVRVFTKLQNSNKKAWEKFKKVIENYKPRIIPPLERGGNTITSPNDIADIFADYYANIFEDPYKKRKYRKGKKKKTYHIINHSQTENENSHKTKNTASGKENTSPDDNKTTTKDTEILARYV